MSDSDDKDFPDILDDYINQRNLHRTEGEQGVKNLCLLVRALGYKDSQHFGQFQNGCYGDLICFLEDNPGAVESIVEWISENGDPEWEDNLKES